MATLRKRSPSHSSCSSCRSWSVIDNPEFEIYDGNDSDSSACELTDCECDHKFECFDDDHRVTTNSETNYFEKDNSDDKEEDNDDYLVIDEKMILRDDSSMKESNDDVDKVWRKLDSLFHHCDHLHHFDAYNSVYVLDKEPFFGLQCRKPSSLEASFKPTFVWPSPNSLIPSESYQNQDYVESGTNYVKKHIANARSTLAHYQPPEYCSDEEYQWCYRWAFDSSGDKKEIDFKKSLKKKVWNILTASVLKTPKVAGKILKTNLMASIVRESKLAKKFRNAFSSVKNSIGRSIANVKVKYVKAKQRAISSWKSFANFSRLSRFRVISNRNASGEPGGVPAGVLAYLKPRPIQTVEAETQMEVLEHPKAFHLLPYGTLNHYAMEQSAVADDVLNVRNAGGQTNVPRGSAIALCGNSRSI
ncbi:unnamed protein product [Anisakis simplex]|uniref:Membrane-associated kinase regulator 6 n=1 Tax=Anisakis simplex TaxID=6269 RepID=A0A0M3JU35_ANISI|nr:unnamed protein product [Anisakis simplex]